MYRKNKIPKGATNGDMIKATFPNIQFDENKYYDIELMPGYYNDCLLILVDKNLWNASYKIKSEKGAIKMRHRKKKINGNKLLKNPRR